MKRTRSIMAGYSAAVVVLTGAYFLRPGWHIATWGLIGVLSVAAIIA